MSSDEPIIAGMAGRYATALFDLALEEGSLDEISEQLAEFGGLLDDSPELARLVRSPAFTSDEKERALSAVLAKTDIGGTVSNFLRLVASKGRLFALPDMLKAFRSLVARHRGEISATVVSASALSDEQLASLKDTLKSVVGKDPQLATEVDASLLGGLIVKVGSQMIDSSLKTKLTNLKFAMKEVG